MQVIGIYVVEDVKADRYDTPYFAINDVMGERNFRIAVKNDQSIFANFTEDFNLYKIGTYDLKTGDLELIDRQLICSGRQLVQEKAVLEARKA